MNYKYKEMKIVILSKPDSVGRVQYEGRWPVEHPPYCLTCGADPERGCGCYGAIKERRQMFFGIPEQAQAGRGEIR